MKMILLVLSMAVMLSAQGVKDYGVKTFFSGSYDYEEINGEDYLVSSSTADIYTGTLLINGGGIDISLVGDITTNGGAMNVLIEVGLDFGVFTTWYEVGSFTADGNFTYNFLEQEFAKTVCDRFLIRITEIGDQSNKYGLKIMAFKWKD